MSEEGRLFVCATPIGNLGDVSTRLTETLATVDVVYAEDTRRVAKLLSHIGVEVPTRSLFTGNETVRTEELVADVMSGKSVALVSDAGMPAVSDPGALAVRGVRTAGGRVTVIPGPSAVTMSIALSGFGGDRFVFEAFLPRKGVERQTRLAAIAREERQVVLFVSPHRLTDDLVSLRAVVGSDRSLTINRELTKLHEEVWSGTIGEALDYWKDRPARGEFTFVLSPGLRQLPSLDEGVRIAINLVEGGSSVSDAAREASEVTGLGRRDIYQRLIDGQEMS